MRRDYFTCVFLGLIAGALMFVCFGRPYFVYGGIDMRVFSPFEICMSFLYFLFFVMFLPIWGAFRKKIWINFGLAAYGLLAYVPTLFYPSAEAMVDPGLGTQLRAALLKGIYSMVQAPFGGVSALMGNGFASKAVYWILPLSLAWLLLFKVGRFYRNAYLADRLRSEPEPEAPQPAEPVKHAQEPEVLGTVITAPVSAASPADVSARKAAPAQPKPEQPQVKPPVKPQVRPVHIKAPPKKDDVIQLGAPKTAPKTDDVIQLGPPPSKSDDVIILGAPEPPKFNE